MQWVFEHIEAYGGDADRIAMTGDSAGAQLVFLTCAAVENENIGKFMQSLLGKKE